jgi:hypothetical protein
VLLIVSISNRGQMPSIARGYDLTMTTPEGASINADKQALPREIRAPATGGERIYYQEDALYNKTNDIPITAGGAVTGILYYILPGIHADKVRQEGNIFTLQFADVNGKQYTVHYTMKGQPTKDIPYIPGLRFPVPPDKGKQR